MQIRRSNQRRRILPLESSAASIESDHVSDTASDEPAENGASIDPKEHRTEYSRHARRRYQLRTTDLIPKRAWSLAAVILLLLSSVFGIILLDGAATGWKGMIGEAGVQTLTIGTPTSLSNWFSSFLLILTALACLQVFMLRQHRSDDYQGVYRWWLWMALILILASLNAVTGIFNVGLTVVGHLFSSPENFTIGWGWALVKFAVLAVLVGRFGYEMRISRGALAGCGVVFAIYTSALVVHSIEMPATVTEQYKLSYGNLMMLGKVAVFTAVLLYSRFIYLEAHGLVKQKVRATKPVASATKKKKKPTRKPATTKSKKKAEESTPDQEPQPARDTGRKSRKKQTAEPASKPTKATRKSRKPKSATQEPVQPEPSTSSTAPSTDRSDEHARELQAEIDELQSRTLSKSERRRLKKLQRRQEQRRAA